MSSSLRFILTAVIAVGLLCVSLVISPAGSDNFRIPKELVLRAYGTLLAGMFAIIALWSPRVLVPLVRDKRVLALAASIALWTLWATVRSNNVTISAMSMLYVMALLMVGAAAYLLARESWRTVVNIALAAALPNAVVAVLQETGIWNPVFSRADMAASGYWTHLFTSGFVGNPNDLGAFLVAPTIAAGVMAAVDPRWRMLYASVAAILAGGLASADSVTAVAAGVAGAVIALLVMLRSATARVVVVGLAAVVVGAVVFGGWRHWAPPAGGDSNVAAIDRLLSNRLTPMFAAAAMARDNPFDGVGPGCFGREYYAYKLDLERRFPGLRASATAFMNFGEAHNDHLQLLAVAGIPAYVLFLAVAWTVGSTIMLRPESDHARYARAFGPSLTLCAFTMMLALFPLELAAPSAMLVHLASVPLAARGTA